MRSLEILPIQIGTGEKRKFGLASRQVGTYADRAGVGRSERALRSGHAIAKQSCVKWFVYLLCWCGLLSPVLCAQAPVTLTVELRPHGYEIPTDFAGISIFTRTQVRDHKGVPGNLFSGSNTQLITFFKNAGLRHLRLGATGSANSGTLNLSHEDIDALFAFAKAADIKVIYSLHFADGVATARYVWDNYRRYLDCFAFDNEPDNRLSGGSGAAANPKDYFTTWKDFAKSVVEAVPGAKFAGPDAAGRTLVKRFVKAEKDTGALALITQHMYVGGNPIKRSIDLPHAMENILSRDWVTNKYPELYPHRPGAGSEARPALSPHGTGRPCARRDQRERHIRDRVVGVGLHALGGRTRRSRR